jgi:hypothetical protein
MIAEVPIVDESEEAASKESVLETVMESVESPTEPPANSVCVQDDFEVEIVEAPKRKRPPKAAPKPKAEPKPKAQPKPKPRPRKAQPIAPPELQPVIPDRFASLSSTELVAELLHRRSHQERDNRRLLYRSFLS